MKHPIIILTAACAILVGCTTDPILLRHSTTGQMVKCGPYAAGGGTPALAAVQREAQCIGDYQRQGYERVPEYITPPL